MAEPTNKRTRTPSKNEVELEKARLKYGFRKLFIWLIGVPLTIASLWFPLQPVQLMVEALAGEETNIGLSLKITVGLAISLVGIVGLYKILAQRKELKRLRARIIDQEKVIKDLEKDLRKK